MMKDLSHDSLRVAIELKCLSNSEDRWPSRGAPQPPQDLASRTRDLIHHK